MTPPVLTAGGVLTCRLLGERIMTLPAKTSPELFLERGTPPLVPSSLHPCNLLLCVACALEDHAAVSYSQAAPSTTAASSVPMSEDEQVSRESQDWAPSLETGLSGCLETCLGDQRLMLSPSLATACNGCLVGAGQ